MMRRKCRRFVSALLTLALLAGVCLPARAATGERFADVLEGHWADGVIHELRDLGLSNGIGNNLFGLGDTITRGEFMAFIVKVMGWPEVAPAVASFTDNQDPEAWYYKACETAAAHDVLAAGGEARPEDAITREEMAVLMVGALGFRDLGGQLKETDAGFSDVAEHAGDIALAKELGLVSGMTETTFAPKSTATREQAAAMIMRLHQAQLQTLDKLHGCYAISSSAQSGLMQQMDAVSFGWSRLVLADGQAALNMSSRNNNEFRLPQGFAEPVNAARAAGAEVSLMVYADNVTMTDQGPLLTTILTDPALRTQAAAAIAAQARETAADGASVAFDAVTIDFEAMKGADTKAAFTAFLQELDNQLGDKALYVTVPPMRQGQAYYDGYDYRAIGQIADRVILMVSDYYAKSLTAAEMDMGYTMTPLSPLNEVYYGLKMITDPNIGVQDTQKVYLQVAMDTVQWKLVDGKVINETPYHPTYDAVSARLAAGVEDYYPNYSYNPYARYHDDTDGTDNVLWYEDARSVQAKMELARLFGLKGVSIWRLGNIPDTQANDMNVWQTITAEVR